MTVINRLAHLLRQNHLSAITADPKQALIARTVRCLNQNDILLERQVLRYVLQFETLRREFASEVNILNVLYGKVFYCGITVILFWLYLAIYLARGPLITTFSFSILGFVAGYEIVGLLVASKLDAADQLYSKTLNKWFVALARRREYLIRQPNRVMQVLNRVLAVSSSESFRLKIVLWLLFPVTYENSLLAVLEGAAYFLLVIDTVGVPTEAEITAMLS